MKTVSLFVCVVGLIVLGLSLAIDSRLYAVLVGLVGLAFVAASVYLMMLAVRQEVARCLRCNPTTRHRRPVMVAVTRHVDEEGCYTLPDGSCIGEELTGVPCTLHPQSAPASGLAVALADSVMGVGDNNDDVPCLCAGNAHDGWHLIGTCPRHCPMCSQYYRDGLALPV